MSFKILKFKCCGLDVHKTWIYACIGITDSNNRTEYKQARFSSFTKGLNVDLCQYFEHKKLKGYADFFNSSSSFCCGVI